MSRLSTIPAGVIAPVRAKCAEVVAATGVVTHVWGYNVVPDHNNRRCVDFMVDSISDGNVVADYLKRHARRLGVVGMIWNHRVMGFPSNGTAYRGPEGQWRNYTGPSPHTDHVHAEFNARKYVPAAAEAGVDVTPAPQPEEDDEMKDADFVRMRDINIRENKKLIEDMVPGIVEKSVAKILADLVPKPKYSDSDDPQWALGNAVSYNSDHSYHSHQHAYANRKTLEAMARKQLTQAELDKLEADIRAALEAMGDE